MKRMLRLGMVLLALGGFRPVAGADARAPRRELETAYAGIVRAMRQKDFKAWMSYLTPDYSEKSTHGKISRRPQIEAGRKQSLATSQSLEARFDIAQVTLKANTAAVAVRYALTVVTKPAMDPQGKTHKIVAVAPMRQTWIKTARGWKLRLSETLKGGAVTVDGQAAKVD